MPLQNIITITQIGDLKDSLLSSFLGYVRTRLNYAYLETLLKAFVQYCSFLFHGTVCKDACVYSRKSSLMCFIQVCARLEC